MNRATIAGLAVVVAWASAAAAQGIVIGSDKPQAPGFERSCVEVEIGGEKAPALNCLNRKLRGQVDKTQTPSLAAPLDANSPDIRLGISNPSAVRQQFGNSYGTGAPPQRPPR
ncbi:MAG: hypothetical protein P4M07_22210 [Xanthobacteraceae bacterium]|nr:hypothetical protein [Xanthobacteraceae bacterium]